MSWRLLLTRPEEDCAALAQSLAAAGYFGHCVPLLATEALPETPALRSRFLDFDHYDAVVVVSKTAARLGLHYLDHFWPQPPIRQQWFAVGAATGAPLEHFGLAARWPSHGDDSEALLALPEWEALLEIPGTRVAILRGEGGRAWLGDQLRERGAQVDYIELYRRTFPDYPAHFLRQQFETHALNGWMVSSGEGLQRLLTLAADDWPRLASMPLFVPSARVAELATQAGALDVRNCRGASASALLTCLAETAPPR